MSPKALADIRRVIANDVDGCATHAIVRWLRDSSRPVAMSLHESLSAHEQQLSRELVQSTERTERGLIAAWESMHPGRRWPHAGGLADLKGDGRPNDQS